VLEGQRVPDGIVGVWYLFAFGASGLLVKYAWKERCGVFANGVSQIE
jgi:hypothetical protein